MALNIYIASAETTLMRNGRHFQPENRHSHLLWLIASWCVLAAATPSLPAYAGSGIEYHLVPGDVLEISVDSASELHRRIPIGLDGVASFPLIGEVPAAGKSVSELRDKVRDLIASKPYNCRFSGGKVTGVTAMDVHGKNELSLEIAEWRPVYITSDGVSPAEVKYYPGMTVRQATAIGGGQV